MEKRIDKSSIKFVATTIFTIITDCAHSCYTIRFNAEDDRLTA